MNNDILNYKSRPRIECQGYQKDAHGFGIFVCFQNFMIPLRQGVADLKFLFVYFSKKSFNLDNKK